MGKLIRFRGQGKAEGESPRALFPPFSGATDARPESFRSDAATSDGPSPAPEILRKKIRNQRGAIFALVLLFAGGTAAALFGDRGYMDVKRQRRHFRELQADHAVRLARVETLRREIDRLEDDPSAIERIAREDLGFVAKDELTLLLPGADPAEVHHLDAKGRSAIVPAVRSTP